VLGQKLIFAFGQRTQVRIIQIVVLAFSMLFAPLAANSETKTNARLNYFWTDNCSASPDEIPYTIVNWKHCCIAHDFAYWLGGEVDRKRNADAELFRCMSKEGLKYNLDIFLVGAVGSVYYVSVFLGGVPEVPYTRGFLRNPFRWRWSYGWIDHKSGYLKHSKSHASLMESKVRALVKFIAEGKGKEMWKLSDQQNTYLYQKSIEALNQVLTDQMSAQDSAIDSN
jgi:hypothetical protein